MSFGNANVLVKPTDALESHVSGKQAAAPGERLLAREDCTYARSKAGVQAHASMVAGSCSTP